MIPGEYIIKDGEIDINQGKAITEIEVTNMGDRPVQIGSHFHFYEVNPKLIFDRTQTIGKRLHIPAGTAVRFEPGEAKKIQLVPFGGQKMVFGFSNQINGAV